jgi:hypothetical protein
MKSGRKIALFVFVVPAKSIVIQGEARAPSTGLTILQPIED